MNSGGPLHLQHIIEARSLTKRFGELVAVDNVSFDILPGECYGILGPNGAGKTTTIRMIYGFSPMTAGELTVFGLDLRKHLRAIKSRIGVCQQENNLDPDLNLLQNLEVFGLFFDLTGRQAREKAETLLAFMALEHRKEAKALELSGGMMRRMVLARALINDPELLILDEPTTGLDPQSRHQVWERLEELKKGGLTVLLTTHYMDEASRLCDRLMIMDHGRILVQGKPADLIRQYVGHDVIEVAEPDPALRAYVKSRQLQHEDFGHRMMIYEGNGGNLYHEISKNYCQEGCILRMATLEDVFLKLTGRELRE
jgi:lipooligosaccharide transport system ATP-binding protein